MKKQILVIILLAVVVVSCLALTACHTCEFGEWEVVKQPTCTQDGSKERVCECGEKDTDVVPATGHTFGEWTEVKAPTCTEAGLELRYCTCAATETRVIEATGHSHEAVVTAPTCTEQGYTTHTCSKCGDNYVDRYVDALGHDEVTHSAQAPTCTAIGWDAYFTCSRCNYTTYEEIEATGHSYNAVVTEPTCTARGYTTHTCSNCDNSYKTYVDATGHSFQGSDSCKSCAVNINDAAVEIFNISATSDDNVQAYIVPHGSQYDVYIKGTGAMKNCQDGPFRVRDSYKYNFLNLYVENGVTSIGDSAFYRCTSLKTITISSSVISIGKYAFTGCFANVIFEEGSKLISIGASAFCEIFSGNSIISIPEGVTNIGEGAFAGTWVRGIIIPVSVTNIGKRAFYETVGNIYYTGTEEQWNNISISSDNNELRRVIYNYTGE